MTEDEKKKQAFMRQVLGTTAISFALNEKYAENARRYDEIAAEKEEQKRIARRDKLHELADQAFERNMETWCNPCGCHSRK